MYSALVILSPDCVLFITLRMLYDMVRPHTTFFFFFFNDPAPPEFSPLPLHAALPIPPGKPTAARRSAFDQTATVLSVDSRLPTERTSCSAWGRTAASLRLRIASVARSLRPLLAGPQIGRAHV